ncbi:MAG: hypothetical protein ACI4U9_01575 [Clostridia bacterium]
MNGEKIPVEQIASIKISSPIIDTSSQSGMIFHIGTFISQQITIKFKNLDGLDLTSNPDIYLEIGVYVNGQYVYIPIGYFLIDELGENYQKTCEITCLDYAVKFKSNLDISQFFNEEEYILASDLFEAICRYYGVEHGTYPAVNNDKKIYFHDSSLSGKTNIAFLAELFAGNAKIGRDGKCYIIPLRNDNEEPVKIDALKSKNIEIGDSYEISRVCFDDGKLKLQAGGNVISVEQLPTEEISTDSYYYLTTTLKYYSYVNEEWVEATDLKNTLYIRQENLFITQQEEIDNIYNAVVGFKVNNVSCENRGDITLDAWDMIKYTTDEGVYYTLNENELTFNGVCMSKVNTNIPSGKKNETTNIILPSLDATIRRVQTIVNEAENSIKTITEKTTKLETDISETAKAVNNNYQDIIDKLGDYATEAEIISIKESVTTAQNESSLAIEIAKKVQTDGVDRITTSTGYTFDEDGLTIQKTGSKVKSTLDETGLEILDATGSTDSSLLFAGYDESLGETIVRTKNLIVEKYLVIGKYSRMEDFVVDGVKATGVFWIGG